jgi:transposase-like protein
MGNRIYDLEFQKDALRLLYKRNGNISEVSKSLGIPYNILKTWEIKTGKSIKQEKIKKVLSVIIIILSDSL